MKFVKTLLMGTFVASLLSCNGDEQQSCNDSSCDKNHVIENIMARRSIRKYKPGTVDRETMKKILECGINAPNGQNKQSWEVRVVDNPATMAEIKSIMSAAYPAEDAKRVTACFRDAPVMDKARKEGYCGINYRNHKQSFCNACGAHSCSVH